jgi:ribosomal protein RSM22 (predicted rRNA methylase)
VAPCPHQGACGLAARASAPNEAWCHHFAAPPQEVFTSRSWREFGERLGIDLRSLPLSFLVLERDAALDAAPTGLETVRILGRPRWEKGRARFEVCHAGGVHSADLLARTNRAVHRALREPEAVPQRYHARLAPQVGEALRLEVCEPIAAPAHPT